MAILHRVANEGLVPSIPAQLKDPNTRPSWIKPDLLALIEECLDLPLLALLITSVLVTIFVDRGPLNGLGSKPFVNDSNEWT